MDTARLAVIPAEWDNAEQWNCETTARLLTNTPMMMMSPSTVQSDITNHPDSWYDDSLPLLWCPHTHTCTCVLYTIKPIKAGTLLTDKTQVTPWSVLWHIQTLNSVFITQSINNLTLVTSSVTAQSAAANSSHFQPRWHQHNQTLYRVTAYVRQRPAVWFFHSWLWQTSITVPLTMRGHLLVTYMQIIVLYCQCLD